MPICPPYVFHITGLVIAGLKLVWNKSLLLGPSIMTCTNVKVNVANKDVPEAYFKLKHGTLPSV